MHPAQFFTLSGSDHGFTAVCSQAAAWEGVSPGFLNPAPTKALGDSHWRQGALFSALMSQVGSSLG